MSSNGRKRILLVRHGETSMTPGGHFIGNTDLDLSATGHRQAAAMSALILAYKPERCLCSPLRRCVQTAEVVIGASKLDPEILPALREIDFGRWEKLTFAEIERIDPDGVRRWLKFDRRFSFGNGERIGAFFSRVKRVAARIAANPGQTILVVTHGGVIRALLCHFLGLPLRHYFQFGIGPASVAAVDLFDGGSGVLASLIPCNHQPEAR